MSTQPKVLLIDDEPDILHVVGLLLKAEGFSIETAISGEAGLKTLAKNTYEMVVCDYLMPKMDGIQLLKLVRDRSDFTSFIFFSGNADDTHSLKMTSLGAYELLPKTQLLSLAEVIRTNLKKASELQEIRMDKTQESKDFLKLLHSA